MPELHLTQILISALIPLIIGSIWYSPKVMGNAIKAESQNESNDGKHHPMVYVMTFIFSILISMLIGAILSTHAPEDMNWQHGAFHGLMASIFMGIPTFAVIAMFESRSIKYILIHAGYWMISFTIMGGILGY